MLYSRRHELHAEFGKHIYIQTSARNTKGPAASARPEIHNQKFLAVIVVLLQVKDATAGSAHFGE